MKMRFVVKRKAKDRSFQATIPEEVRSGAEVRAVVERPPMVSSAIRPEAVEGKRARKLRLMRENEERYVTFYISTELWGRFVKLCCPGGTPPNVVFCRMIREAVEAKSQKGALVF
jgi:hypothetical protein